MWKTLTLEPIKILPTGEIRVRWGGSLAGVQRRSVSESSSQQAVIITGTRRARRTQPLMAVLDELVTAGAVVLHGACRGVDTLAAQYLAGCGGRILVPCPAQWKRYGNSAGPRRNLAMVAIVEQLTAVGYAPLVLAFPDTRSKGTRHMVALARKKQWPVVVTRYEV